jgi:hypothetical protein
MAVAGRAEIRLDLDLRSINGIGLDLAQRQVADMTRATFNRSNVLTPVDTGRLRAGNNMRLWTAGLVAYGEVFNHVEYAPPVHNGARPHIIRPRLRKALKFRVNGQTVFATEVHHPGNKPRPWILKAMVETAPRYGFTIISL